MASGAIDGPLVGINVEVLKFSKLVVDIAAHHLHFARGLFRALLVTRQIRLDVAMHARHAECIAIPAVHDLQEGAGWFRVRGAAFFMAMAITHSFIRRKRERLLA